MIINDMSPEDYSTLGKITTAIINLMHYQRDKFHEFKEIIDRTVKMRYKR